MNQPKDVSSDAVRFFHESVAAGDRGDFPQSYQLLLAALKEDPNLSGAWNNLGVRLHDQRRWAPAAAAFAKALSFAPEAELQKANYAWNLHHAGREDEALPIMLEVVAKHPGTAQHWVNLSQIHLSLNQTAEALVCAEKACSIAPRDHMPLLSLALSQLRSGNYAEGLKNYEARFPYIPVLKEFLNYPYPMWRNQDIRDQRLFIAAEQGLGDSVMFLRFIPEAIKRARHTVVFVHDSCYRLFKRNLSGNVEIHPLPSALPVADIFTPMLSLPVALGLTNDQIKASYAQQRTSYTPCKLPDKPRWKRIGICWAGDPAHDNDRYRSARLEDFIPLAEAADTQLYSLQIGERSKDLDTLATHAMIHNMAPYLKTALDTASFIRHELDAVVTVDTSVAHIAGSVGKPTFMVLGKRAVDWRWLTGEGQTPWYPSMKLFMQKENNNWKEVMQRVQAELANLSI